MKVRVFLWDFILVYRKWRSWGDFKQFVLYYEQLDQENLLHIRKQFPNFDSSSFDCVLNLRFCDQKIQFLASSSLVFFRFRNGNEFSLIQIGDDFRFGCWRSYHSSLCHCNFSQFLHWIECGLMLWSDLVMYLTFSSSWSSWKKRVFTFVWGPQRRHTCASFYNGNHHIHHWVVKSLIFGLTIYTLSVLFLRLQSLCGLPMTEGLLQRK